MTTNKPEVVGLEVSAHGSSPLIRLSDYEVLQAECEKLRSLIRHAQPIIRAHAGASHMLDGFRPKRNQWDELVEGIDAAMQEVSHDN